MEVHMGNTNNRITIISFSDFYEEEKIGYIPGKKHFPNEDNSDEKMTEYERFFVESYEGGVQ